LSLRFKGTHVQSGAVVYEVSNHDQTSDRIGLGRIDYAQTLTPDPTKATEAQKASN
jgi:hypothetical protein